MFNIFRLAADAIHLLSKLILIFTIHRRKSAEGISLLTQSFYALVFCSRYLDLFVYPPWISAYNTFFKIFYIASSFYILFLMLKVYPRSREGEYEWKISGYILGFSVVTAPIFEAIFKSKMTWIEGFWTFSIILESLAVIPQITLLRHISIPTAITSYYLLALGTYRALYIPNWIWRSLDPEDDFYEPIPVIFGVIQTLLYIEFAWIYYRRQKVKLRDADSGVLDRDDMARGLVLGRLINVGGDKTADGGRRTGGSWRGEGLSVSADQYPTTAERDDESDESDLELELENDTERLVGGRKKNSP
ncbi:hypothetical protein RUND412_010897 [Rhizina undulata]